MVVIPCFNEEATIKTLVGQVLDSDTCGLDLEIIVVDDGSRDRSFEKVQALSDKDSRIKVAQLETNRENGSAVRTGFDMASSDIVIVQDVDLEYDPAEYPGLLQSILSGAADVVFGSRFRRGKPPGALFLAQHRQPVPNVIVEHVDGPQPHRHGDLLQGLPPRNPGKDNPQ